MVCRWNRGKGGVNGFVGRAPNWFFFRLIFSRHMCPSWLRGLLDQRSVHSITTDRHTFLWPRSWEPWMNPHTYPPVAFRLHTFFRATFRSFCSEVSIVYHLLFKYLDVLVFCCFFPPKWSGRANCSPPDCWCSSGEASRRQNTKEVTALQFLIRNIYSKCLPS